MGRSCSPGGVGTRQEKHSVEQHRRAPADEISQSSRAEGAQSAAKQHRGNGESCGGGIRAEGSREGVHGSVDNATIKTEEKTSESRYGT